MSIARPEYEEKLRATARQTVGVPFLHNGREPSQGLDCLGLIVYIQRTTGISDFPDADKYYPSNWHVHASSETYLNGVLKHGKVIPQVSDLRVGDCIMFRLGALFPGAGSRRVQHIGLVLWTNPVRFVQTMRGRNVVESNLQDRAWHTCFVTGVRPYAVMRYLGED